MGVLEIVLQPPPGAAGVAAAAAQQPQAGQGQVPAASSTPPPPSREGGGLGAVAVLNEVAAVPLRPPAPEASPAPADALNWSSWEDQPDEQAWGQQRGGTATASTAAPSAAAPGAAPARDGRYGSGPSKRARSSRLQHVSASCFHSLPC